MKLFFMFIPIITLAFAVLLNNLVQAKSFTELEQEILSLPHSKERVLRLNNAKEFVPNYTKIEQANYYLLLGTAQQKTSHLNLALESFTQAINILTKNNAPPSILLADLYSFRASSKKEIDQSSVWHCDDRKISLVIERKIPNNHARIAEGISDYAACLYSEEVGISAATKLFEEAIEISQKYQLTLDQQATIYNRAALLYQMVGIFDAAYKYTQLALQLWKEDHNLIGVLYMQTNLINSSISMEKWPLAQQHLNEKYQFIAQHPELKGALLIAHYMSGKLAYIQKNWLLSIKFLKLAIEERKNSDEKSYIQASFELLSVAQFRAGLYQESYTTIDEFQAVYPNAPSIKKDILPVIALKNDTAEKALLEAYHLLDLEKKAKRNFIKQSTAHAAQLNQNNLAQLDNIKLQQRFTYAVTIGMLMVSCLIIFTYFQLQKRYIANKEKTLVDDLLHKKNQLLADVSHELSTPLTVLKLQVESLKDDLEDDVQITYDALDNKIDDIQHLIDDIHQLAQSDVGALQLNFESFELNSTLDSWENELTQFVNKNKLNFEIIRDIPINLTVNFDRDRIKQIFINLLTNSIKYTDKPGHVKLLAREKNSTLYLSIEDSAPSVLDKDLVAIFERLYRVESSRSRETGGSGLGLAICKSLIEAHNGEIHAEQSVLGGLKIIIALPIAS